MVVHVDSSVGAAERTAIGRSGDFAAALPHLDSARMPMAAAEPARETSNMSYVPSVDLWWLPLGAGGRFVRLNGLAFEAVVARLHRRTPKSLYHSALTVNLPEGQFVIEMAWPIPDRNGALRGAVAEGTVGSRWAGSVRVFRYEVRRWRDGVIPDLAEAVESPQRLTDDPCIARRVLDLVPDVPAPVWGRDELHAGEMWNSNSLISWLIARSGLDVDAVRPPVGGRAPGWQAETQAAAGADAREQPQFAPSALDVPIRIRGTTYADRGRR